MAAPAYNPQPEREIDLNAYLPIFQKAYAEQLQQPGQLNLDPVRSGTANLIQQFQQGFNKSVGRSPTTTETEAFLAENLTPRYAAGILQGINLGPQAQATVNEYLQANPTLARPAATEEAGGPGISMDDLLTRFRGTYPAQEEALSEKIRAAFAPQRARVISDEAALGRLRSPASISNIARVDDSERRATTEGLGQLAASRASGELDIGKTIAGILENQANRTQQGTQFGQTLGLQKKQLSNQVTQQDFENMLKNKELNVAGELGRAQADAKKPGILDYINTAFSGLTAAGTAAAGISSLRKK